MSLSKKTKTRFATMLGLVLSLGMVAGCTVQPLYGDKAGKSQSLTGQQSESLQQKLASIAIDEPANRFDQIVRNRLIYLFSGGAGEPSAPRYQLTLNSKFRVQEAVRVNVGNDTEHEGRASSGTVIASAHYVLKQEQESGRETVVQMRRRSVTSSFDRPRQEYANLQAEEDAKKRAAEELAESIYLSVAQNLANKGQNSQ